MRMQNKIPTFRLHIILWVKVVPIQYSGRQIFGNSNTIQQVLFNISHFKKTKLQSAFSC